jgi:hypothetical protein
MNTQYLPTADADRVIWLNNFNAALPQYAAALGLTTAEVQTVSRDAAWFAYVFQLQNDARQYLQAMTQYKNSMRSNSLQTANMPLPTLPTIGTPPTPAPAGIFNRIATLVMRIKRAPGYSPAIGQALDIIPAETTFNPNDMAPDLSIRIDAGHPLLRWKKGEADGAAIYVDRRDGNGFALLVETVKTSYIDIAPLPANTFSASWDYKARYFIGDDEVGNFSPVISINVIRTA